MLTYKNIKCVLFGHDCLSDVPERIEFPIFSHGIDVIQAVFKCECFLRVNIKMYTIIYLFFNSLAYVNKNILQFWLYTFKQTFVHFTDQYNSRKWHGFTHGRLCLLGKNTVKLNQHFKVIKQTKFLEYSIRVKLFSNLY